MRSVVLALAALSIFALVWCTGDDPKTQQPSDSVADAATTPPATGTDAAAIDTGSESAAPGKQDVIVLGQPDAFSNIEGELGMAGVLGVAFAGERFFAADYVGQRVLIWNKIPTQNLERASLVVGKPSLSTVNEIGVSAKSLFPGQYCDAMAVHGDRLFVADTNRHRGLIWNPLPTTDYRAADVVIGSIDFTSVQQQQPMLDAGPKPYPASAATLAHPCSMATDGTRLFVADHSNHRIAVWNQIPTTNGRPADWALGQADLGSNSTDCTNRDRSCIHNAVSVFSDGKRLWVTDYGHSRVLQWNTIPTSDRPADVIIGGSAPSPTASTMAGPRRVFSIDDKLFVADQGNHRVLIWNSIPTADNTPANVVVGQPNATSGALAATPDARSVSFPVGVASDGKRLAIGEIGRVLLYNDIPTSDFAPADVVLGRPTMTATRVRPPDAKTFQNTAFTSDGKRFLVGEMSRILIWDHIPTGPTDPATQVLGQDDFTTVLAFPQVVSNKRFHIPGGLWADATRIVMADTNRQRVLVWNRPITANNQPADLVLGQPDFAGTSINEGNPDSPTATSVSSPSGVFSDGTHLALADSNNHRVLIWNTFPTRTHTPADVVLGQEAMTLGLPNQGTTPSASTLNGPSSVHFDGTRLWVVDNRNHRVLSWTGWPTRNAAPADWVIGQPDFAAIAANQGAGVSAQTLSNPGGVVVSDGRLYIGDRGNHRVLVWNAIPTTNNRAADAVLGQADFMHNESNQGGLGPRSLSEPGVATVTEGRLWISDSQNKRILGWPVP